MAESFYPTDIDPSLLETLSQMRPLLSHLSGAPPSDRIVALRRLALSVGSRIELTSGLDLPDARLALPMLTSASDEVPAIGSLIDKVAVTDTGCWSLPLAESYDSKHRARYPQISARPIGRHGSILAHRYVLLAIGGPGYRLDRRDFVDHVCRQHSCCNPTHLEVVTPGQNTIRGLIARQAMNNQPRLF